MKKDLSIIPEKVFFCLDNLHKQGFEAYIVGGCTRDFLRDKSPADWDLTTNATPEEIQKVFNDLKIKTFYENDFGTVGVAFLQKKDNFEIIEITTYRKEAIYSDNRHPDKVTWSKTIEEDLKRRDFTVNAIAMTIKNRSEIEIIDLFDGQKDLKNRIIRAVGTAKERFSEDALRMMRAVRLKTTLGEGWTIEEKTKQAIKDNAPLLQKISKERIRDELVKIINNENAAQGIESLRNKRLLTYIIPELEEGFEVGQNKHHVYDCYKHNLECLNYSAKKGFNFHVRMASLLHDIGKPRAKRGEGINSTFYNHEIIGAQITEKVLDRLRFSKKDIIKITNLVRYHLFYYNVDEVGEASVRRLIKNVGLESVEELLQLRMADRIGSGCPKAEPYKLRHLKYMIEKVSKDPVSVKMLKINGQEVMDTLKIKPSPTVGMILDILLEDVLKEPKNNTKAYLKKRLKDLGKLNDEELSNLAKEAKEEKKKVITKEDQETKEKYWVA
ncbi:MAG TPA: HD domain-containing protein [Candidatus Pacearchaeota archaeon]|nr:HD domain-containing protein [Candidatus Pacearchaeota archaeon]HPR79742.1 HD domain-containing protein [Candidatus Pacearchaeota archaeon]